MAYSSRGGFNEEDIPSCNKIPSVDVPSRSDKCHVCMNYLGFWESSYKFNTLNRTIYACISANALGLHLFPRVFVDFDLVNRSYTTRRMIC